METTKEKHLFWNSRLHQKKSKYILAGLSLFAFFVILFVTVAYKQFHKANEVFYDAVQSIVEVKATQENVSDNYGTAVFVDERGYLITNAHIVTCQKNGETVCCDEVQIRLPTEDDFRLVTVVDYDEELDLAVLFLEETDFVIKPISFADSETVDYGDKVYAIGNAMNYGISMSEGIISSPEIDVEYDGYTRTMIQADIVISSGSSGGALLDTKGRLIGITSFRMRDSEGNVVYGIAFSIPSNTVLKYILSAY